MNVQIIRSRSTLSLELVENLLTWFLFLFLKKMSSSSSSSSIYKRAKRIEEYGDSVWVEIAALVKKYEAVNLGQGMPNFAADDFVKDAATAAVSEDWNQYTRSQGHPRLVSAICDRYTREIFKQFDESSSSKQLSNENVLVTVGACQSLYLCMQALIDPGDEVIVIEPYFDFYRQQIELAGGVVRYVPLRFAEGEEEAASGGDLTSAMWRIDIEELSAAFTDRTRMLVLNSPHNPSGKVFSRDEFEAIAALVRERERVAVLSDEVYERLVFDDTAHVHFASLPGMWERTVTVCSAGKTFSVTGWKIGWSIAPAPLIKALWTVLQYVNYTVATPLQEAVAVALEKADANGYWAELPARIAAKRDRLVAILRNAGLKPIVPQGGYFVMADTSSVQVPRDIAAESGDAPRDFQVAHHFARDIGIAAIPPSAFYCAQHKPMAANLLRFCFMKTDQTFVDAEQALDKIHQS
jgi:kynurenine---oxoglutarate transaminase / cysteine-S-conjugate beta-lyase / glutamine---phenylpyruvate transaminase